MGNIHEKHHHGLFSKLKRVKESVAGHLHEPTSPPASPRRQSTARPPPPNRRLSTVSTSPANHADSPSPSPAKPKTTDARASGPNAGVPQLQLDIPAQSATVTRPFVKVKVVTWNMAESLPTGDLTEILGSVPRPEACNNLPKSPLHPDLPDLPLNDDHLYHIVVVGAQESPWLPSTIHDIRSGTSGKRASKAAKSNSKASWNEVLIDWYCKGGSHRFSQQHESSSPVSPTSPLQHRDGRASKSPEPTHDEENALLEKKEHPVQTESLGTSLEPVLKIQEQDPMELLPDSPSGGGPSPSGPLKPPTLLSKRSSASSSSSSANGRSSVSGPRLAVPGAEAHPASRDDASSISSSANNEAFDPAQSSESSSNAGDDDDAAAAAVAAGADDDPTNVDDGAVGPYVFVAKERLLGIYVSVFVLKSAHHLLSDVAKSRVTAGLLGGRMGNKGAAAVAVHFAGLRFLFLSAHLAAHQTNVHARKQNIVKIKEELDIDHFSRHIEDEQLRERLEDLDDVTDRFDACFWFGDLNFRLDISRLHADWLLQSKSYNVLLEFDQLKTLLKERNSCLKGFREAPIDFAPTYKYDVISKKLLHRRSTQTNNSDKSISSKGRPQSILSTSGALKLSAPASDASQSVPSDTDVSDAASISSATTTGAESSVSGRPTTPSNDYNDDARLPLPVQKARARLLTMMRSKTSAGSVGNIHQELEAEERNSNQPLGAPRPQLRSHKTDGATISMYGDLEQDENSSQKVAVFDSSKKQRVQSYTDRILYKSRMEQPADSDKNIAQKLGAGIVDTLRSAGRSLGSHHPLTNSISRGSATKVLESPPHSCQVSFDVQPSPSRTPRTMSVTSALTPSTSRPEGLLRKHSAGGNSVRSNASSQRSGSQGHHGSGRIERLLHKRREARLVAARPRSLSNSQHKSDPEVTAGNSPGQAPDSVSENPFTASPEPSQLDLLQTKSAETTPVINSSPPLSASSNQLQWPSMRQRVQRDDLKPLSHTHTSHAERSSEEAPFHPLRSHRQSSNAFSLRHWWYHHMPLPFWSRASHDSLDLNSLDNSSTAGLEDEPQPQLHLVGPEPGHIDCLAYNTANDLLRMEAQSDHRPLYGVYAVGLEPVT